MSRQIWVEWFTYAVLAYFLVTVGFWLYRLNAALGKYDPLFIIPLLQASYIVLATLAGGIYFQEFQTLEWWQLLLFFGAVEDAVGIGQFAQHIVTDIAAPERETRHVGHEAPFQFHDGATCVWMDKANIGAGENLEAAPKGHTMRSGDDRRRNLTPSPGDILRAIGDAVRAVGRGAAAAPPLAEQVTLVHPPRHGARRGLRPI